MVGWNVGRRASSAPRLPLHPDQTPIAHPYRAPLHKRSLDGFSAGAGSPGRGGDPGSKPLLGALPFLFLPLHACVTAGPPVPAASRRGPDLCPDGASRRGAVLRRGEGFQPGTANSQTHWGKTGPGKAPQLCVPLHLETAAPGPRIPLACPSCRAPGFSFSLSLSSFLLFLFFIFPYFFFLPQRISCSLAQIGSIEHLPNLTLSSLHLSIHLSN